MRETWLFPDLSETDHVQVSGLFSLFRFFFFNEIMLAMNEVGSKRARHDCLKFLCDLGSTQLGFK